MDSIITRNLTRSFGKLSAVDRLNLRIPTGSIYGLIGPNGAGKTTTLRMLAGLLEPSSGEIRIHGMAIRQYWNEIQWQIGYMPDYFGVYEDLLVWEYLDFFARCYKLTKTRRKQVTSELLELVDLEDKRDVYVHTLSRGMRQRLCLAHTLVHDPQVLILDEPASGLDPRARVEMRELLRELRSMGKTILLSSHILTELAELCDTVGIIEKGHLIESGTLDNIRQRLIPRRRLRMIVISNLQKAATSLGEYPGVNQVHLPDEQSSLQSVVALMNIDFEFTGDHNAMADLLNNLISQGIRITSFSDTATDLEQVFLSLTQGDIS
jgi:ABC-2 type transport system ATP-binding protein